MGPPGGNKSREPPLNVPYPDQQRSVVANEEEANYYSPPEVALPQNQSVRRREQHAASNASGVDSTDGRRLNVNVNIEDDVTQSTPNIFTSFVVNRMENDGYDVPAGIRNRRLPNNEREIAQVLQRIGDDMSNNKQLNHLIGTMRVTPDTAYKTFVSVASQIFQDGNINWGRIVTLFYFAYKLAVQVMNQLPLVDIVIGWVTKFTAERLARWILERGGWGAVREYFGATQAQLMAVFLAGMAISSLFWWLKK